MSTIDEGRNSAVECSPWDGGAGKLPPGLEGGCWAPTSDVVIETHKEEELTA